MRRPNVLVFICDDIGFNEIGAYQGRFGIEWVALRWIRPPGA